MSIVPPFPSHGAGRHSSLCLQPWGGFLMNDAGMKLYVLVMICLCLISAGNTNTYTRRGVLEFWIALLLALWGIVVLFKSSF